MTIGDGAIRRRQIQRIDAASSGFFSRKFENGIDCLTDRAYNKTNDVKQPQAYLEVSIVELNENGSKEFQNSWNIDSKAWKFSFDGSDGKTNVGRLSSPGTKKFIPAYQKSSLMIVKD